MFESLQHKYFYIGVYNSIGRVTVCGTVGSLFESGYTPLLLIKYNNTFIFTHSIINGDLFCKQTIPKL